MKATLLLLIAMTTCASAADAAAPKPETGIKRTDLFKQVDKNKNFKIDGNEPAELRQVFATVDSASPVKKIDVNKNGKLEDAEVEAFSAKYSAKAQKPKKAKS